MLKIYKKGEH